MPDLPAIRDAVAFGTEALRSRGAILGLYAAVRDYFRRTTEPGERPILILGPGGVGKTTLARILATDYHWIADPVGPYAESLGVEKTACAGSPGVEVVTAPGQDHRRQAVWPDLLADVAAGKYRGVVLVTAAGFLNLRDRDGYKSHQLYTSDKAAFVEAYRAERLAAELAVLDQLAPHLQVCRPRVWLLTVVAKQDLWADRAAEVTRLYREGGFAAATARIAAGKSGRDFRHELAFASLVINNLVDVDGAVLAKNVAGYDQPQQAASLVTLLNTLDYLRQWEDAT